MLIVPIMSILYLFTKYWLDKKQISLKLGWLFFIVSFAIFPMSALGVMNYYYIDDSGLHYNHIFETFETSYLWEEIVEIVPYGKEGEQYYSHFMFEKEDGIQVEVPATWEFMNYRQRVFQLVEDHGGEIAERKIISE